jgi:hypothetical protein
MTSDQRREKSRKMQERHVQAGRKKGDELLDET